MDRNINLKTNNEETWKIKRKNKVIIRRTSSHHFCSIGLLVLLLHPCHWVPYSTPATITHIDPSSTSVVSTTSYHRILVADAAAVTPSVTPSDEESSTDKRPTRAPIFGQIQSFVTYTNATTSSSIKRKDTSSIRKGSLTEILTKAGKRGIGGGIPGAIAGVVQVFTLMWLRTVINYQCRYGTSFVQAFATLYRQGGLTRFYKGLPFAIIQAPLSRFISTAANDGVESLLSSLQSTKHWGAGRGTIVASLVVGIFRVILMPIDTCKTVLQVDSTEGFRNLMRKVRMGKIHVLYQGAVAQVISAVVAHYPWFYSYKTLSRNPFVQTHFKNDLVRNGAIGFVSSIVSDLLVNVVRVIKTTKQAIGSKHTVTYGETVAMILAADGWRGLFGRGLKTRIVVNALNSIIFTIVWRGLSERWSSSNDSNSNKNNRRKLRRRKNSDMTNSEQKEKDMEHVSD